MTDALPLPGARGVLLDLDGTVYEAGRLIPGAREAVDAIRGAGLPLRFAPSRSCRGCSAFPAEGGWLRRIRPVRPGGPPDSAASCADARRAKPG